MPGKVCTGDVNNEVSCELCAGYLIDATTMIQCPAAFEGCPWLSNSDAFCRSCLFKHLYGNGGGDKPRTCPVCKKEIEQDKLGNAVKLMRSDHTLQDLVYKLVPGLYRNELKRRRDFYDELCKNEKVKQGVGCENKGVAIFDRHLVELAAFICTPDEIVSLSLEYAPPPDITPINTNQKVSKVEGGSVTSKKSVSSVSPKEEGQSQDKCKDASDKKEDPGGKKIENLSFKRYFRCPAAVTIGHLKKLLQYKLELASNFVMCLSYKNQVLEESLSLMDLAYIFSWTRKAPMQLFFSIFRLELEGTESYSPEQMPMLERESTPSIITPQSSAITPQISVAPPPKSIIIPTSSSGTFAHPRPVSKQKPSGSKIAPSVVISTTGSTGDNTGTTPYGDNTGTTTTPYVHSSTSVTPASHKSLPKFVPPTPILAPTPVPTSAPLPASIPASIPASTPISTPAPIAIPIPTSTPALKPTPAPMPVSTPSPMPAQAPKPVVAKPKAARAKKSVDVKRRPPKIKPPPPEIYKRKLPEPRKTADSTGEMLMNLKMARMAAAEVAEQMHIDHMAKHNHIKREGGDSKEGTPRLIIDTCDDNSSSNGLVNTPVTNPTILSPHLTQKLPEASPNRRKRQMAPPKKKLKQPDVSEEEEMDTNFNTAPILKSALMQAPSLSPNPSSTSSIFPPSSITFSPLFRPPIDSSFPPIISTSSPRPSQKSPLFRPPLDPSFPPILSTSSPSPSQKSPYLSQSIPGPITAPPAPLPPRLLPRPGVTVTNSPLNGYSRPNASSLPGFLVMPERNSIQLALVNTNHCR